MVMLKQEFIGKGALIDLFGREKEKEISHNQAMLGMLNVLVQDMEFMRKQQERQLLEQEKIHCKTLEIDKTLSEMVDNQKDMKKSIDVLVERWG